MNVFVTGASGLVGQSLINRLVKEDKIDNVICLYRNVTDKLSSEKAATENLNSNKGTSEKVIIIKGDLNTISEVTIPLKIDMVVHLVGYWAKEDRRILYDINVNGTKNVIEFCKKNGIQNIIYLSTINVNLKTKGHYAKTKLLAEEEIKRSGLLYNIMRPSLIYGNGDRGLSKICDYIRKSNFIPVFGNGKALEQPISVEEVSEYILRAMYEFKPNIIFAIAGKNAMAYDDMLNILAKKMGKRIKIIHIPAWMGLLFTRVFEALSIRFFITSEQISHMAEDLCIDAQTDNIYYDVELNDFEDNIEVLEYL